MRRILLVIVAGGMLLAARGVSLAQVDPRLHVGVGLHLPIDAPSSADASVGFAASLRKPFCVRARSSFDVALHFGTYSAVEQQLYIVLPTVEYSPLLDANGRWAASFGIGPLFAFNSAGPTSTDLGLTVALRYAFSRAMGGEVRYIHGPKDAESSVALSLVFPLGRR